MNRKRRKIDDSILLGIMDKRIRTKSLCFEYVNPDVFLLLERLKMTELRLAIISNYSPEEVKVIKQSKIYKYFDKIILSYEVKMQKPDICLYKKASDLLGVAADERIFRLTIEKLEVGAAECLYIDDRRGIFGSG